MGKRKAAVCVSVESEAVWLQQQIAELLPGADIELFHSGAALLDTLEREENSFDLIILECHAGEIDGLHITEKIRQKDKLLPVIFISDTEEYYREAFDLFAFQYFLRPVTEAALRAALESVGVIWGRTAEHTLHFQYRSRIYTLKHSMITHISSSLHTVNFHLSDGRTAHCRGKLDDFAEQLENSSFLRCHQSFFVNLDYVVGMKNDSFVLADTEVPISRSHAKKAQEVFLRHLGNSYG